MRTRRQGPRRESSKARSTSRFIVSPFASGNSAPVQAPGAPVSGVRFAVKTLPRCASALSAGFPPRILPARTNKKGRRCASAPSAPRLLRLRPPPVFDLENYSQQKDLKNPFRYSYLPVRWSGSISIASSRMLRLVSTISALYFGRR